MVSLAIAAIIGAIGYAGEQMDTKRQIDRAVGKPTVYSPYLFGSLYGRGYRIK